jgi:hypothetical protein
MQETLTTLKLNNNTSFTFLTIDISKSNKAYSSKSKLSHLNNTKMPKQRETMRQSTCAQIKIGGYANGIFNK